MADILNSNDYKRGFEDGKADAMAGHNKNYSLSGGKFVLGVIPIPSAKFMFHDDKVIDSYNRGYNDGYETAMKTKLTSEVSHTQPIRTEIISNNNNTNLSGMAQQTTYSYQIELAEGLKSYLHNFQDRLGAVAQNYRDKGNQLHDAQMMGEDFANFSQNYIEVTVQKIQELINQINECDIPFVEKLINYLESNISV